jgi:hypothetical protein
MRTTVARLVLRVLGCWGGAAPVTSLEYRGCGGSIGGGGVDLAASGRPAMGGDRGCCRRRNPKKEVEAEGDDWRRAEPVACSHVRAHDWSWLRLGLPSSSMSDKYRCRNGFLHE